MSYYPPRVRPVIPGRARLAALAAGTETIPDPADLPYLPAVADVGALLRARTKATSGQEIGTFDDTTRPTADEVTTLIVQAAAYVSGLCGLVPDVLFAWAGHLVTLYTAVTIEEGYFPEQVGSDRSARDQYWERFQFEIGQLIEAVGSYSPTGTVGGGTSIATVFTPPAPGYGGWYDPPVGYPGSQAYTQMTEALGEQPDWPPRIPPDGPALPRV